MILLLVSAKLAAMVELWGLVLCPSMIGSGIFSLRPQDAAACVIIAGHALHLLCSIAPAFSRLLGVLHLGCVWFHRYPWMAPG